MKVVIFAGGRGTRIAEESHLRPKPMIEIGGRPILWHIMKLYAAQGYNEFVICLGYRGYMIKEYFLNYFLHQSDVTVHLATNDVRVHNTSKEDMQVTLVDTGLDTQTAGRLRRVQQHLGADRFMLTYGDGLADIDLNALLVHHRKQGRLATLTAIQPGSRFGVMDLDDAGSIRSFQEKPSEDGNWINGGFFVLEPGIFDYLHADADTMPWERQPLADLARSGQLTAYRHTGFWKCMDTLRDREELEQLWHTQPKWKLWADDSSKPSV